MLIFAGKRMEMASPDRPCSLDHGAGWTLPRLQPDGYQNLRQKPSIKRDAGTFDTSINPGCIDGGWERIRPTGGEYMSDTPAQAGHPTHDVVIVGGGAGRKSPQLQAFSAASQISISLSSSRKRNTIIAGLDAGWGWRFPCRQYRKRRSRPHPSPCEMGERRRCGFCPRDE